LTSQPSRISSASTESLSTAKSRWTDKPPPKPLVKGSAQPVDEAVVNPNGALCSGSARESENAEGPGRNRGLPRS
jgi:hypothetical protein